MDVSAVQVGEGEQEDGSDWPVLEVLPDDPILISCGSGGRLARFIVSDPGHEAARQAAMPPWERDDFDEDEATDADYHSEWVRPTFWERVRPILIVRGSPWVERIMFREVFEGGLVISGPVARPTLEAIRDTEGSWFSAIIQKEAKPAFGNCGFHGSLTILDPGTEAFVQASTVGGFDVETGPILRVYGSLVDRQGVLVTGLGTRAEFEDCDLMPDGGRVPPSIRVEDGAEVALSRCNVGGRPSFTPSASSASVRASGLGSSVAISDSRIVAAVGWVDPSDPPLKPGQLRSFTIKDLLMESTLLYGADTVAPAGVSLVLTAIGSALEVSNGAEAYLSATDLDGDVVLSGEGTVATWIGERGRLDGSRLRVTDGARLVRS